MPEHDRASVANALAGALVLADLGDSRQAAGFAEEVRAVGAWADEAGDEFILALAHESLAVIAGIENGEITAAEATAVIGELLAAVLETAAEPGAAGAGGDMAPTLSAKDNPYAQDRAVMSDFVDGAREQLDEAEALLSARATGDQIDVGLLFRCFHTLKGIAGFLALDEMAAIAHTAESELEGVRSGTCELDERIVESSLAAVDRVREIVASVEESGTQQAERGGAAARRAIGTVRVDAERLEGLLDALGELAVAEAEVASAVARSGDEAAMRSVERLQRIAREMHATATSLRMISLDSTFRKMSRVVRDITARSGKLVEMTVSGGDTELDRTIVEGIADPLVHLLRNAVDHGIEDADVRIANGKPPVGRVELRAFHKGGSVYVEVEDDGRGIDAAELLAKAASLGIDAEGMRPTELIFMPGFSTAGEVTEVSGRGVGMDAVAAAVSSLRGQIDVRSTPGSGTTVSIRLPLTLAIIDGIVLLACTERYIVPTHFVDRVISVTPDDIVSTAGAGEALVLPEGAVVVVRASAAFGGELETGAVAVVLDDGESQFALLVDEVVGQQSLVIKSLTGPTTRADGLSGAALMGDGRAALVVDPSGIVRSLLRGWDTNTAKTTGRSGGSNSDD